MSAPSRPTRSRVARRYRSTPDDPVAAQVFFQRRVRTYLGYALAIWSIAFLGDRVFAALSRGSLLAAPNQLYLTAHYVVIAVNGLLYAVSRAGERGPGTLRAMEIVATLSQAVFSATLLAQLPLSARPEFLALFAATLFLILRAGLVPGSVGLALAVGAASIAPSIVLARVLYSAAGSDNTLDRANATFFSLEWGSMALLATTAIHAVIYGLEERVQELGQYTLLHKIGEGGMGVVYRARHSLLRRPTAVKLLPLEKAMDASIARFEREVQLTAKLTHPNIVRVYDFGKSPDGAFYYAMEYLDGIDLQRLVDTYGPQGEARVVHLLRQAADALADAHEVGLIHRDVKPANLLVSNPVRRPDHLTVLDFGLALQFGGDPKLTGAGELRGTPLYLAPESILDPTRSDERSDVYALGAVAYFLLTGTPPFSGGSVMEVCAAHLHAEPEPPSARIGAPITRRLEELVLACLAKAPELRPRTASELLERLEALGVSRWPVDAARAWWDAHGPVVRESAPPNDVLRTLAVAAHESER